MYRKNNRITRNKEKEKHLSSLIFDLFHLFSLSLQLLLAFKYIYIYVYIYWQYFTIRTFIPIESNPMSIIRHHVHVTHKLCLFLIWIYNVHASLKIVLKN